MNTRKGACQRLLAGDNWMMGITNRYLSAYTALFYGRHDRLRVI